MKSFLTGLLFALAIVAAFCLGRKCSKNAPGGEISPKVDTLLIHDTIKVTEPISVTKRVVDSIPYPVVDTLRLRDTLFIYLPKEQIRWEDSLSVVYASGVMPQVDSVIHHTQGPSPYHFASPALGATNERPTRGMGGTLARRRICPGWYRAMYSGGAMYGLCGGCTDSTAKKGSSFP